ncbi:MAG TPA: DUF4349 domain-containing protein [Acidimicrobiales bacterium]
MTMFDEATLRAALHEAADNFEISSDATDQILASARATGGDPKLSRTGRLVQHYGRGRSLIAAVAAGVVVLLIAVPLVNNESGPSAKLAARTNLHGRSVSGTGFENGAPLGVATPSPPVKSQGTGTSVTGATTAVTNTEITTGTSSAPGSSLRVEETGTVDLSVSGLNFQMDLSALEALATSDLGYVAQTHAHIGTKRSGTYSSGFVILEVPERKFAALVSQVRQVGHATSVVTSATDVTGQYVDLQARIHALQVSRQQYLTIMTRTSSINGILSVQSQLNSIQSQIEQLQASLGLLNSETTYGSLTVSLTEIGAPHVAHPALSGVAKAWHDSIHGFVAGFEWLIRLAGPLLFALLCLAALLVVGRLVFRATRRRRNLL